MRAYVSLIILNTVNIPFVYSLMALFLAVTPTTCLHSVHQIINKMYQEQSLYSSTQPYNEGYLQVSEQHSIYFAEFGNPEGVDVVTIHGGPGSQCYSYWTSFFDPSVYHVVMFDQRGAGRSIPFAEMDENTPQNSVEDMEKLRNYLGVDRWIVFGGSYGSFLSLLYGEAYPENCLGFVLRGVWLCSEKEYKHLLYGMKANYPEVWDEMVADIPEDEREDLINAFHRRVMDPDPDVHLPAARAFMRFDIRCATLLPNLGSLQKVETNVISTLGIARAFIHYAANAFFVEEKQILNHISRIAHLPAIIVHGRYDVICPPQNAYDLYRQWPNSELWYISDAGHAASETGISQALREAMDQMKYEINRE